MYQLFTQSTIDSINFALFILMYLKKIHFLQFLEKSEGYVFDIMWIIVILKVIFPCDFYCSFI